MHPEGWKPFTDTLKSPYNLVLLTMATVLLVDYFLGCPLMSQVVRVQLQFQKLDPEAQHIRLYTLFGTFTRVDTWTRFLERFLIIVLYVFPGLSLLRGLYAALSGK